ncbi:MAG: hypothetical protein KDA62_02960 [Planctomycetales bacterium]|nr:hypothetical protein [Planctomycetales bacterium]
MSVLTVVNESLSAHHCDHHEKETIMRELDRICRRVKRRSGVKACLGLSIVLFVALTVPTAAAADRTPRIAAVVTEYRHNSHADVIVSRLLQTETLDGKGRRPDLELVSLYTDQVPSNDTSRKLAAEHGFKIFDSVAGALTLGGDKLAVDGVLLVAEHGDYAKSETGQTIYPKRRLFEQIAAVFEANGRGVPVFCDKHLADNWEDAKWLYDSAAKYKAPLMAGSSLPTLWRYPAVDVRRDAKLEELVAVSYHTLDAYGFHAVEMVQSLVERRAGGETGVRAVRCIEGNAVWQAAKDGVFDRKLLDAALSRLKERPLRSDKTLEELVKNPVLFTIEYEDGLKAHIVTLNGAVVEWTAAWRYQDDPQVESTVFWTQEARPYMHFSYLLRGVEQMMHTGRATWPVERTLMTSGVLDSLLISKLRGGERLETPHLKFAYRSEFDWRQPPPPPPGRDSREQ